MLDSNAINAIGSPWELENEDNQCQCGARVRGRMTTGEGRCCATCAFHPQGCRCRFGELPDTVDDSYYDDPES